MVITQNSKRLIVSQSLPNTFGRAIVTFIRRESVRIDEASRQFQGLLSFVETAGFELVRIPICSYPDESFKQDHGLSLGPVFLLARLTPERAREIFTTTSALSRLKIKTVQPPTSCKFEGGDTIPAWIHSPQQRTIFVGQRSKNRPRTNREALDWIGTHAHPLGHKVIAVPFEGCLHLTTGAGFIGTAPKTGEAVIAYNQDWVNPEPFVRAGFRALAVPRDEPFSANMIRLGETGTVVVRNDAPKLNQALCDLGFRTALHPWEQMALGEAGFTCCFNPLFQA